MKIEANASTNAGTIDVDLSWDGGSTYTSTKATATLTTGDVVYTLGGTADTWGRSWSGTEFSNANFRMRITGQPSSNTVQIDAIQVKVHHVAGGGGGGGGGEASVIVGFEEVKSSIMSIVENIIMGFKDIFGI